jgi:hypothetical protein
MGFGAGFSPIPFVQFNVEYKTFSYDKADDTSTPVVDATVSPEVKTTEILVSVSLPLSF